MIQNVSFSPVRYTASVNPNFLPAPEINAGNDFRDILAGNKDKSIYTALASGSERDKLIDAINQARIFTPPTFIAQPAAYKEREPEYSISVVNNLRMTYENSTELQRVGMFNPHHQSEASLCLSKIFKYALNGDENGMVTVTNEQIGVQWQFHLYGEDREFIENLDARIQEVMRSKESINAAYEKYRSGGNLTKDEILDGIIAQYANEPLTIETFKKMLFDFYSHGALTYDETWLVDRWGGLGIDVVMEEYERDLWLRGITKEYPEPRFTVPELYDQFMKMLDERRNARAEAADKQEDRDEQNRKFKDASGVYESSSDIYFNNVTSTSDYFT